MMNFNSASGIYAVPQLLIVLGIMVLVHEAGHFIVAKLCGVRVETFAVGFGKRLFGVVHNGTDYCVNMLPLGGYVKMAGVGDEPISGSEQKNATLDPGELQNHPRWQRTLITLAGPVANFLLAFVLLLGLYMSSHEVPAFLTQPAVVDYVSANTPAAKTGIAPGDRIVHFETIENPTWIDLEQRGQLNQNQTVAFSYLHDGKRADTRMLVENKGAPSDFSIEDSGVVGVMQSTPIQVLSLSGYENGPGARAGLRNGDRLLAFNGLRLHSVLALIAYLQDDSGKPVEVAVQRASTAGQNQDLTFAVVPERLDTAKGKSWKFGFTAVNPPVHRERLGFRDAANQSAKDNVKGSLLIFEVLHRLFTRQVSIKALSSPIGIGAQVHDAFNQSTASVIEVMAEISLNLGIFNLLPIPILDGGMIVFLFIESVMRRDMNQQLKERIYQVAFVCLVLFAAVVIFNDLSRIIPGHLRS